MFNLTKLKILWDKVTGLEKSGAAADTKIAALEAAAVRIPKNYSETEQNTGVKWIDGKDIYFKTLSFTSPSEGNSEIDLSAETIISYTGTVINTSLLVYEINRYFALNYSPSNEKLYIPASTNAAFINRPCLLIVYYTKPDPVPGNREPDDEPETKATKATKKKATK